MLKKGRYTSSELLYLIEFYPKNGPTKCGAYLNRSPKSVSAYAKKHDIPYRCGYKNINHELMDNFNSAECAYVLGFLWADGSICHSGSNYSTRFEIVRSDYFDIREVLYMIGDWTVTYRKRCETWQETAVGNIQSRPMYEWLKNMDFHEKSEKSPSKVLRVIPVKYHHLFWRGFLDGDGCVRSNNDQFSVKFSGSVSQDWGVLEYLLESLGISYGIALDSKHLHKSSAVRIQNRNGVYKLLSYIYQSHKGIGLSRKEDISRSIIEYMENNYTTVYELTSPCGIIYREDSIAKICENYNFNSYYIRLFIDKGVIPTPYQKDSLANAKTMNSVGWTIKSKSILLSENI